MVKNNIEVLPGWTLFYVELSNNIYKVTLTDSSGRKAETTDTDLEKAIHTAKTYAFDIQKKISKDWKKFLFDCCIEMLSGKTIFESRYDYEVFGS